MCWCVRRSLANLWLTLVVAAAMLALTACDPEESDPSSAGATCQSTCEKSTALACPNDPATVELCVSQCESQIAMCSDAAIVQRYLDCVLTTPMMCGDTTGQASSPECLEEGLTYFACLNGITPDMTGGDTTDTEDSSGGDTTVPSEAMISGSGTLDGAAYSIACSQSGTQQQFDHQYGGLDNTTVFYCKLSGTEHLSISFDDTRVGTAVAPHFELEHEGRRIGYQDADNIGLTVSVQVDSWDSDTKTIAGSFSASWTHAYDSSTGMYPESPGSLSGTFGGPLEPL